jgi:hypothetical protein
MGSTGRSYPIINGCSPHSTDYAEELTAEPQMVPLRLPIPYDLEFTKRLLAETNNLDVCPVLTRHIAMIMNSSMRAVVTQSVIVNSPKSGAVPGKALAAVQPHVVCCLLPSMEDLPTLRAQQQEAPESGSPVQLGICDMKQIPNLTMKAQLS